MSSKHGKHAAGNAAVGRGPVAERARASEVDAGLLTELDAAADQKIVLRSQAVPRERRHTVREAALFVLAGVGIGGMSKHFGPPLRRVLLELLSRQLGHGGLLPEDVKARHFLLVLARPDFVREAVDVLGRAAAAATTYEPAAVEAARRWLHSGMHASYAAALDVVLSLGGQIQFDDSLMSCDAALLMAFKKELSRVEKRSKPKAKPAKKGGSRKWVFYQAPVKDNPYRKR